jgi:predicted small lipoprotein YifL
MARATERSLRLGLVIGLLALSLAACGRRGSLEAPANAIPNAPDVTTRLPRQKPPEVKPAEPAPAGKQAEPGEASEPKPKPDRVLETTSP